MLYAVIVHDATPRFSRQNRHICILTSWRHYDLNQDLRYNNLIILVPKHRLLVRQSSGLVLLLF